MGPIGVQEMMLIFILALLMFGPKKLPELARMLGKGLSEFRRAKSELQSTFNTHMQELERESRIEEAKKSAASSTMVSAPSNPYAYAADEFGHAPATSADLPSGSSNYLSEPPVDSHSSEPVNATETQPQIGHAVVGSVPRSNGVHSIGVPSEAQEEHHA